MSAAFPYSSTVDPIISALVSLWTAALKPDGVIVRDGPWTSQESKQQEMVVGWSGFPPGYEYPTKSLSDDLGEPDVIVQTVPEGLGPQLREKITVNCASLVRKGSAKIPDARTAAYHNMNKACAMLASFPTLNGATMRAVPATSHKLNQVKDTAGALVIVTFAIQCDSYAQQG